MGCCQASPKSSGKRPRSDSSLNDSSPEEGAAAKQPRNSSAGTISTNDVEHALPAALAPVATPARSSLRSRADPKVDDVTNEDEVEVDVLAPLASDSAASAPVEVEMTLTNISFSQLDENTKNVLSVEVQKAVAAGAGVKESLVSVSLSPGSVKVLAEIVTPPGLLPSSVREAVANSGVSNNVLEVARSMAGVQEAATGSIEVEDLRVAVRRENESRVRRPSFEDWDCKVSSPEVHEPRGSFLSRLSKRLSVASGTGKRKSSLLSLKIPSLRRKSSEKSNCPESPNENRAVPRLSITSSSNIEDEDDEMWDVNAWAEVLMDANTKVENGIEVSTLFERFRTCETVPEIYAYFAKLFALACGKAEGKALSLEVPWRSDGDWKHPYEDIRGLLPGSWKAKQLWTLLDKKVKQPEYVKRPCCKGSLVGKQIVIIGAGPIGLRQAVELRLLGANVTVLEKRNNFSRINRLHLWKWCGEDLKELGARVLEPPPSDFGSDPDLIHIGIGEIQFLLFKTALLLGVRVHFGTEYIEPVWVGPTAGWAVRLKREHGSPGPSVPPLLRGVAVLIGADGLGRKSADGCGIQSSEVGCVQAGGAIGLVVNFENTATPEERSLRCFNLARQFAEPLFKSLAQETGAVLENIVYTKSKRSHYFVMTPTLRSLVDAAVVKDGGGNPLLGPANVNMEALEEYSRKVVAFPFKDKQKTLTAAVGEDNLKLCEGGPMLFDFSKMRRALDGASLLDPPEGETQDAEPLIFMLVGDALLEPFWPEGLGIIRGFFSTLDCASALSMWSSGLVDAEEALAHYAASYAQLKSLTAKTSNGVIKEHKAGSRYGISPESRYRSLSSSNRSIMRSRSTSPRPAARQTVAAPKKEPETGSAFQGRRDHREHTAPA